jgi:hypothetical protein
MPIEQEIQEHRIKQEIYFSYKHSSNGQKKKGQTNKQ